MSRSRLFSGSVKLVLITFFTVTVFLPIIMMFSKIKWNTVGGFVFTQQFGTTVLNSLSVTVISTIISVLLAYILAYAINRSKIPFKGVISILITLPMLIPSISHGMGLINVFGVNGLFTKITGINIDLLGFNGIVIGSILYSFPVAFLMLSDAMKYADSSIYEAADVLGVPSINKFASVTMQYMKRPLISATFAVFTMIFTDYGVPLAVGGRFVTLPVYLYREVIGLQDFSKGAFIGMILLFPAIVTFIIDLKKGENESMGFTTKKMRIKTNKIRDSILLVFCLFIIVFVLAILFSFVIITLFKKYPYDLSLTFEHMNKVFKNDMLKYFGNSLLISSFVALLGTIIAYITAYVSARTVNNTISKVLHLTSISSLAIPGIVLGLGYLTAFNKTFLYGTLLLLILVNIIHFFSSPYMMAHNAMKKLNPNFEDVGKTLGVDRVRILRDVFVPSTLDTITEMFGYFFVNSMITISAVAFLYTTKTMPLSIMINQYENSMALESAAFVSLVILISNIISRIIITIVKRMVRKFSQNA